MTLVRSKPLFVSVDLLTNAALAHQVLAVCLSASSRCCFLPLVEDSSPPSRYPELKGGRMRCISLRPSRVAEGCNRVPRSYQADDQYR